jgi:hypothetical protein
VGSIRLKKLAEVIIVEKAGFSAVFDLSKAFLRC